MKGPKAMSNTVRMLTLPGWQNSGPTHWQTLWEQHWGGLRVQQSDWLRPRRGDWAAQLNATIVDTPAPVAIVAHSLGCILLAWWAAHASADLLHKIHAALLVAPGDIQENAFLRENITGWNPIAENPLPFSATVIASENDPFCSLERAQYLAQKWGANFINIGAKGHINADSHLGEWSEGKAIYDQLCQNII